MYRPLFRKTPLFFTPDAWKQQHQQRHDLKPAEQHRQAQRQLAQIGEKGVVPGRTDAAETGTDVADGGERSAERCFKVRIVQRQNGRAKQQNRDIGEEKDGNGGDGLLLHAHSVKRDGMDAAGVENAHQLAPQVLEEHHDAGDLDAAGGRTGAAAGEHQKQQQKFAEVRPKVEIRLAEAGGGNQGSHMERSVSDCRVQTGARFDHKVGGNERHGK